LSWTWIERAAKGELDRIACISHSHREPYRIYRGFDRMEMVYTGVDVDLIDAAPSRPRSDHLVLWLSIPRRTKGLHNLLRAWNSVRRAIPDVRLRVCGSASMHEPSARLGRTGILDSDLEAEFPQFFGDHPYSTEQFGIELAGARALQDVYSDLKSAAVAIVNCNWRGATETFCRSAVEAQIAGTPVVGAAGGSLPEVVADGKSGLLVEREDSVALGEAVVRLLQNRTLCQEMGAAGKILAARFADYSAIAQHWEFIARRALDGDPVPTERRFAGDVMRILGYGQARLWARRHVKRLLGR